MILAKINIPQVAVRMQARGKLSSPLLSCLTQLALIPVLEKLTSTTWKPARLKDRRASVAASKDVSNQHAIRVCESDFCETNVTFLLLEEGTADYNVGVSRTSINDTGGILQVQPINQMILSCSGKSSRARSLLACWDRQANTGLRRRGAKSRRDFASPASPPASGHMQNVPF